jgi:hypothetical protein
MPWSATAINSISTFLSLYDLSRVLWAQQHIKKPIHSIDMVRGKTTVSLIKDRVCHECGVSSRKVSVRAHDSLTLTTPLGSSQRSIVAVSSWLCIHLAHKAGEKEFFSQCPDTIPAIKAFIAGLSEAECAAVHARIETNGVYFSEQDIGWMLKHEIAGHINNGHLFKLTFMAAITRVAFAALADFTCFYMKLSPALQHLSRFVFFAFAQLCVRLYVISQAKAADQAASATPADIAAAQDLLKKLFIADLIFKRANTTHKTIFKAQTYHLSPEKRYARVLSLLSQKAK